MKPKTSVLFAVVVRVGVVPYGHLIVENHVTVREPVASCVRRITNACPVDTFESATLGVSINEWIVMGLVGLLVLCECFLVFYSLIKRHFTNTKKKKASSREITETTTITMIPKTQNRKTPMKHKY